MTAQGRASAMGWLEALRAIPAQLSWHEARLEELGEEASPEVGLATRRPRGSHGDPTAARARRDLMERSAETRAIERLEGRLRDGWAVLDEMRGDRTLDPRIADIVEAYYIDGMTWDGLAAALAIPRASAVRLRDRGVDWLTRNGRQGLPAGGGGVAADRRGRDMGDGTR